MSSPTQPPHNERRPVAYLNEKFLNSPDARALRILAEFLEPLAHFRRELEFPSVRLADYALAPDRAVFTVQGPCGK